MAEGSRMSKFVDSVEGKSNSLIRIRQMVVNNLYYQAHKKGFFTKANRGMAIYLRIYSDMAHKNLVEVISLRNRPYQGMGWGKDTWAYIMDVTALKFNKRGLIGAYTVDQDGMLKRN